MNKNEVLIELSESNNTKFGKEPFVDQSIPQKVFSTIWTLESEVNNGGFKQYFSNSNEDTGVPFVVEALETIRAPKTADICHRAISVAFPTGLPTDSKAIADKAQEFCDEVREELGALDNEFFAYPHSLTDLLYAYVKQFPDEFGTLPELS